MHPTKKVLNAMFATFLTANSALKMESVNNVLQLQDFSLPLMEVLALNAQLSAKAVLRMMSVKSVKLLAKNQTLPETHVSPAQLLSVMLVISMEHARYMPILNAELVKE